MKRIQLTRKANKALEEILQWTMENFGVAQSRKYRNELMDRIGKLASGVPPRGRPVRLLIGRVPEASDLLYYQVGRHLIIYRDTPDTIAVGDFLHTGRDIKVLIRE